VGLMMSLSYFSLDLSLNYCGKLGFNRVDAQ